MPHCTCGCGCENDAVPESKELQLCEDCLERRILTTALEISTPKEPMTNRLRQVARISCEDNRLAAQYIFQHDFFSVLLSVS